MARKRQSTKKASTKTEDPFPEFDPSRAGASSSNPFPPFDEDRPKAMVSAQAVPMGLSAVAKELEDLQSKGGVRRIAEQLSAARSSAADALGPHMKEYADARRRLGALIGDFETPEVEQARERLKSIMGEFDHPEIKEARQRLSGMMAGFHTPEIEEAKTRLGLVMGGLASIAEEAQDGLLGSRTESVAEQFLREEQKRTSSLGPVVPPIELLRNPIHETNEHLATTNEKIDALIQVQAKQTDLVDALLAANVAGSAAQERLAKANVRLTIMSVILGFFAVLAAFFGAVG